MQEQRTSWSIELNQADLLPDNRSKTDDRNTRTHPEAE